ncbi:unnamed protein product [Vicia faba]|uniref:Uncharacterized protein n=1 Tax=Vicia faba TaxID=3906 RepID=A0AAV0YZ80_VICFA|nr:unnamed protein product [Vicia faba]
MAISANFVLKIMVTVGFLGPAFFLTQFSHIHSPVMVVLCMTYSQGTNVFSQSGLYLNHQDIAPRYSGILLGLSNTAGVLAGVLGTTATGYILQHGSWDDVFKVTFYVVSSTAKRGITEASKGLNVVIDRVVAKNYMIWGFSM